MQETCQTAAISVQHDQPFAARLYRPRSSDPWWTGGARLALNIMLKFEKGSEPSDGDSICEVGLTKGGEYILRADVAVSGECDAAPVIPSRRSRLRPASGRAAGRAAQHGGDGQAGQVRPVLGSQEWMCSCAPARMRG